MDSPSSLLQLARKTSKLLTEALQCSRDVVEALQALDSCGAGGSAAGADPTDSRWHQQPSQKLQNDVPSSLGSSAATSVIKPSHNDSDSWLHARPTPGNLANSGLSCLPTERPPQAKRSQKLRSQPAVKAGAGSQDDFQVLNQSTWEKAQNRLLKAIDIGGGGKRKARRSQSAAHAFPPPTLSAAAACRPPPVPKKRGTKLQRQQRQIISSSGDRRSTAVAAKSATTAADASAEPDALTSTLNDSLARLTRIKTPTEETTMEVRLVAPGDHSTAACLRSADRLLLACRQALAHPTLASAYADTVRRQAQDLLTRLELCQRQPEGERSFAMFNGELEQLLTTTRAAAESKVAGLSPGPLKVLIEALARLQMQLQFHLHPEAILPMMEPGQRLQYFSKYCCLLTEDCNRLVLAGSGETAATAAATVHFRVLLCVMRYFVGNLHLLAAGPAACGDRVAPLMRCYERLERLNDHRGSAGSSADLGDRLRQQSGELGSELTALCEHLVREAQPQLSAAAASPRAATGGEAGSWGSRQTTPAQQQLRAACLCAEAVIWRLKRLMVVDNASSAAGAADDAAEAAELARSVARLLATCEQQAGSCGGGALNVKPAYLDKLRHLMAICDPPDDGEGGGWRPRALPFESLYSVLTDTLLLRRSLRRRLQLLGTAAGGGGSEGATFSAATADTGDVFDGGRQEVQQQQQQQQVDEVRAFLALISAVVCDLYLAMTAAPMLSDVFNDSFLADLRRLVALANRRGFFATLDSVNKRLLRQSLAKFSGYVKASNGGSRLPSKSLLESLIRLLLEVKLHLDRDNLASSEQLWQVRKTVPFSALVRYLTLRGSRVVQFTCWSQDTAALRTLLSPQGKDPAILRVERQCRCAVAMLLPCDEAATVATGSSASGGSRIGSRCRLKSALLTVELQGSGHKSHTACIRLLGEVLKAKRLALEPFEGTVQVAVQL